MANALRVTLVTKKKIERVHFRQLLKLVQTGEVTEKIESLQSY